MANFEGDQCYPPGTENCDKESTVLPIASFEHTFIRSVIGGYVTEEKTFPGSVVSMFMETTFVDSFNWILPNQIFSIFLMFWSTSLECSMGRTRRGDVLLFTDRGRSWELYATSLSGAVYKLVSQQRIERVFRALGDFR